MVELMSKPQNILELFVRGIEGEIWQGLFANIRSCFPCTWQACSLFILCHGFHGMSSVLLYYVHCY